MTWADTSFDSIHGKISTAWKRFRADPILPSGSISLIQPCPDLGEVPRQQFTDPFDRMIGDTFQYMAHVEFRIEAVEFGCSQQSIDRSRAFSSSIGRQLIVPEFWRVKSPSPIPSIR